MYLPSLNELNKNAMQQKVVDQDDERVRKTSAKGGAINGQVKFSVNPQDNSDVNSASQLGA